MPGPTFAAQLRGHVRDPDRPGQEHDLAQIDDAIDGLSGRLLPALDRAGRVVIPFGIDDVALAGEAERLQVPLELGDVVAGVDAVLERAPGRAAP